MMNQNFVFAAVFSLMMFPFAVSAQNAQSCSAIRQEIPGSSSVATASTTANIWGTSNSLKVASRAMIQQALQKAQSLTPPAALCPAPCQAPTKALINFKAVPQAFLSKYSDQNTCDALLTQTQQKPFLYPDRKFSSLEDFYSWYNDFSTGSGTDGKDLYQKCSGSCSPQYSTYIQQPASGVSASASVICGPARDKSNDQYNISYSLVWQCQ